MYRLCIFKVCFFGDSWLEHSIFDTSPQKYYLQVFIVGIVVLQEYIRNNQSEKCRGRNICTLLYIYSEYIVQSTIVQCTYSIEGPKYRIQDSNTGN